MITPAACFNRRPRLSGTSFAPEIARFVVRATAVSILCLFSVSGCATKREPLVVAYGRLVRETNEGSLGIARYEVSSIQRGTLRTNTLYVLFQKRSQTNVAPDHAILVLCETLLRDTWRAVGQDFRRGILPDTPANRKAVAATSVARLLDNPKKRWLPRSQAEGLIRDHLKSEFLDLSRLQMRLRRDHFGWSAAITYPDEYGSIGPGRASYAKVTDDGIVLYWIRGL